MDHRLTQKVSRCVRVVEELRYFLDFEESSVSRSHWPNPPYNRGLPFSQKVSPPVPRGGKPSALFGVGGALGQSLPEDDGD